MRFSGQERITIHRQNPCHLSAGQRMMFSFRYSRFSSRGQVTVSLVLNNMDDDLL